jgi:hypothetical protein
MELEKIEKEKIATDEKVGFSNYVSTFFLTK